MDYFKKSLLAGASLSLVLLAGCNDASKEVQKSTSDTTAAAESNEEEVNTEKSDSNESKSLEKVGQWIKTTFENQGVDGKAQLLGELQEPKRFDAGYVDVEIAEVIIIKYTADDPANISEEYFQNHKDFLEDEKDFYVMSIGYKVINDLDVPCELSHLQSASTDLKKQYSLDVINNKRLVYGDFHTESFLPDTVSDMQYVEIYLDKENANKMKTLTIDPGYSSKNDVMDSQDTHDLVTVKIDR